MATPTALRATVARNDPCPCGSGRRFKDCHGSLRGAPAAPPAAARKRRYRPSGDDWDAIGEDDRDRLGALMELALEHQRQQRVREAERLYRAVLEQAPRTHDALHMLGVVRLGLGDFADAERLIRSAMALRPAYPAIETNWSLVRRSIAARDRRGIDIVCEHALPLLFESIGPAPAGRTGAASRAATGPLHIVAPAADPATDSGWMTRRLTQLLAPLTPVLWQPSGAVDQAQRWQAFDHHRLDPPSGRRPREGHVILTSTDCDTDAWLRDPIDRVLVFIQPAAPSLHLERLRRIAADGARSLTPVFDSHAKARRFGRRDHVVPPPIDLDEYADVPRRRATAGGTIRVATIGQDGRRVVAAEDAADMQAIAEHAGKLSVLDPGPLRYALGTLPSIECVPRGERSIAQFVGGADVYLQRRGPWWNEDDGRALFGAMALGVPVLCPRGSIHAEYLEDGVDGWLYDDGATALSVIDALRADRARIIAAGSAARAKARAMFEPRALSAAYVDIVTRWMAGS